MQNKLLDFVTKIPKSDLHVHLDGSVRINTIIELSKKQQSPLPSYTATGLEELVFKDNYKDLNEYLQVFGFTVPIMQTPENLERIAYEFAEDNINEGVCYVEVRFAPHLHINDKQNIDEVLLSVNRGLNRAKIEYNSKPEVKTKKIPEFNYGIIVCAMRYFDKGYSQYFDHFIDAHRQQPNLNEVAAKASFELVKESVRIRDKYNIPIVALDIAGAEAGNPPFYHQEAYNFAHKSFMHLTAHAGEAYGPESIFQAVTMLHAERIGHGFYLFSPDKITDPTIKDKNKYIENLVEYTAKKRITIEVCLTSNLQVISTLKALKNHPFAKMLEQHLSTVICTDNRTVSKTNVTKELMLAIQHFDLKKDALRNLIINSFKKSFYPGSYTQKLSYIKQISDYYDSISNNILFFS